VDTLAAQADYAIDWEGCLWAAFLYFTPVLYLLSLWIL
jgi:hypothetical protein